MTDVPMLLTRDDVAPWLETLCAGALNDDARQLIGSAAGQWIAMFDAIDRHYEALRALEKLVEHATEDDDARIKVAALRLRSCPGEVEVRARILPLIVQLVGKAQAANKGEADAAIVQLRQFAAKREQIMDNFGPKAPKDAKAPKGGAK